MLQTIMGIVDTICFNQMFYLVASRNLSSNYFNGSIIPTSIFNTSANLTVLDLSHNNFTGLLPNLSIFSNSLTQL
jgi:hypothetical protein